MFDLLIISGVIGSFLFFLPGRIDGAECFSLYFLALCSICSFFVPPKRTIQFRALGLFAIAALLSLAFNLHAPEKWVMLNLFVGVMACLTIAERTTLQPPVIGFCLAIFFVLHNVILIAQHLGFILPGSELAGTFVMPWVMGCVACLSIPFIKSFNKDLCVFLIPSLWLSHSTICVLVAVLLFWQPKQWKALGLTAIAVLSYILIYDRSIDTARFTTIVNTSAHVKNWLIGNGIGSFGHSAFVHFNGATPELWKWAHLEAYQVLFETGFLGLAALGMVVVSLWRQNTLRWSLIGVISLSVFHPIFHFPQLTVLLVVIFALIMKGQGSWELRKSTSGI